MKHLPFPSLSILALAAFALTGCFKDSVTEPEPLEPVAADTAYNVFANLPGAAARTGTDINADLPSVVVDTVRDLPADTASAEVIPYAYFDLDGEGLLDASGDTAGWDLAFRSTGIRVRGGAQLIDGSFDSLLEAPESGYGEDGNVPDWYDYSGPPDHLVTPTAGQVIVVKTEDGKYAKLEVLSYYKGAPESPSAFTDTSRYYTFRYLVQPDGSRDLSVNATPRTYFSLRTGEAVADSTEQWDLAFRSTAITVNGEAQLVGGHFESLTTAPTSGYSTDAPAWYDYSGPPNHLITPKSDTLLMIKTADGNYAKIEILSYYKGSPENPSAMTDTSRHYSFRYFLQEDGGTNLQAGTDAAPRTYFSLQTGSTVADSTQQWDLAFRTTTLSVNGEAQLLTGVNFDDLPEAPEDGYSAGAVPSWYDYNLDGNHTVTPKVGGVIVMRTADGNYAKIQILSYYEDFPTPPVGTQHTARYYTFRYVLQVNGTRQF